MWYPVPLWVGILYVGRTSCALRTFTQHRSSTRTGDEINPIAARFSKGGHDLNNLHYYVGIEKVEKNTQGWRSWKVTSLTWNLLDLFPQYHVSWWSKWGIWYIAFRIKCISVCLLPASGSLPVHQCRRSLVQSSPGILTKPIACTHFVMLDVLSFCFVLRSASPSYIQI